MSYATLLVYVNADHVSKPLVSVSVGLADNFWSKLIGLSALGVIPPFVAEGVVIVDNATEADIALMEAKLARRVTNFVLPREPAVRPNGDRSWSVPRKS